MPDARSVISIGVFDGVHLGHRALLARARELAAAHGPSARVLVLAFDPHPAATLRPEAAPPRLTTFDQRRALLLEAGADEVVRLNPTPGLLSLTPAAFVEHVLLPLRPVHVVEGPDFRFGKGRSGDLNSLRALGLALRDELAFDVYAVEPRGAALFDNALVTVSSSLVRWLLSHGRVRDAAALLGAPYALEGSVVAGDRRGRTLGFPTANLSTEQILPADGVYAALATALPPEPDAPPAFTRPAAVNVGTRPTFAGNARRAEAFLLDAPIDGGTLACLPEYGWRLRLSIIDWIREDLTFSSADALVAQMHRDVARCRETLARLASHAPHPRPEPVA